jgi:hypothetical protein
MLASKTATTVDDAARLLLSQVRALQRMHRAGLTPHYGQLETLFDVAEVLDRQLHGDATEAPAKPRLCGVYACEAPAVALGPSGRPMCFDCLTKEVTAQLVKVCQPLVTTNGASQ